MAIIKLTDVQKMWPSLADKFAEEYALGTEMTEEVAELIQTGRTARGYNEWAGAALLCKVDTKLCLVYMRLTGLPFPERLAWAWNEYYDNL